VRGLSRKPGFFSLLPLALLSALTTLASSEGFAAESMVLDRRTPLEVYEDVRKSRFQAAELSSQGDNTRLTLLLGGACRSEPLSDPTGTVRPFVQFALDRAVYEAKAQAIDEIANEWAKLDELTRPPLNRYILSAYQQRFQIKAKVARLKGILSRVKGLAVEFMAERTRDSVITSQVESRLADLDISAPYGQDPRLLFSPIIEVTGPQITIGGLYLESVESEAALINALAHESAHRLRFIFDKLFAEQKTCIALQDKAATGTAEFLTSRREEIRADLFAHELLALYLDRSTSSRQVKFDLLRNSGRFFCGSGGSALGHPTGEERLSMMERDPVLRAFLLSAAQTQPAHDEPFCSFTRPMSQSAPH
jgi:hypothetical protein